MWSYAKLSMDAKEAGGPMELLNLIADDAKEIGFNEGYDLGLDVGLTQGLDLGYSEGFGTGLSQGLDIGYDDGFDVGLKRGLKDGYTNGQKSMLPNIVIVSIATATIAAAATIVVPKIFNLVSKKKAASKPENSEIKAEETDSHMTSKHNDQEDDIS